MLECRGNVVETLCCIVWCHCVDGCGNTICYNGFHMNVSSSNNNQLQLYLLITVQKSEEFVFVCWLN